MNPRKFFYVLFLAGIYGSIFFQFESWPWSDFRVYKSQSHPNFTSAYRFLLKNNEKERWIFSGQQVWRNNAINHVAKMFKKDFPEREFEKIFNDQKSELCHQRFRWAKEVIFKKRFVKCKNPDCDGVIVESTELFRRPMPRCQDS